MKDVQFPALPAGRVKVSGKVLGPNGSAVTKGTVYAFGSKLEGADPDLAFSLSYDLGVAGTYEFNLPIGDYRFMVFPDPGFPVTAPSSAFEVQQ